MSQQTSSLALTEVGPQFSNQDSRLGLVVEKAKKLSTLQYPRSISVTTAILISKVQSCRPPLATYGVCACNYMYFGDLASNKVHSKEFLVQEVGGLVIG